MVCHSLLQWTTFCQTSPPWPDRLGWPHMAWLCFTELDKTVVQWSDWLVFCAYGFSVSALWCPLAIPTVLLGLLLPWYLFMAAPEKHGRCSLPRTRSIFSGLPFLTLNVAWFLSPLLRLRSNSSMEVGLLFPAAAPDLGRGVAPLRHRPWLPTWESSSPLLPLTSDVGKLLCTGPALSQPGALGRTR